ncbi:hypothetical protein E0F88_09125 [Dyadobacter psychrotolerans]|uniref:DUF5723 domain-containing protein n=2 Tax=Dyadobacter psychrotolerans TaxID=2541721 RepID=A0A4R5DR41_9BACT|nr:hypothetical protein E0F88_09125 [Dyadobacter psychrotolerans]
MGEFYGDAYSDNAGMGQSGVSTGNGFQINNLNPALWTRNRFTTLDIGIIGQYKDIVSGNKQQQTAGANLAYVSLAFPVSRRWTLGASLKPYSFIDFENTSARNIPGTPNSAVYYNSGKGGINKASITNAYQIGRYVSLGLESSYFFGNIRRASEVLIPLDVNGSDYLVGINDRTTYSDFAFKGGAAVRIPIKKDNKLDLNLGGSYSFKTRINGNQTSTLELTQNTFVVGNSDTLTNNLSSTLTVPQQYQVGMSLEWPFKLILSADYSHQSWSQYRGFNTSSNDGLTNTSRIHLGVEYQPRFLSLNYFDRVRYRVGFSHGNTPYVVNNRDVKDTNVSLGFTFPMGRGYQNFISLAFIGGQRGATGSGMIRERYGRAVLGITLLDRWFEKQKLN